MEGPRYFQGGKALSQAGGHGDMRPGDAADDVCGCAANSTFSEVVDGVDAVRKFCRNELRKGADHIKIFISGGVSSPTDPVWKSGRASCRARGVSTCRSRWSPSP